MSSRLVDELDDLAQRLGIEAEQLDEFVHDEYSQLASAVNNEGRETQLAFLIERWGPETVRTELTGLAGKAP